MRHAIKSLLLVTAVLNLGGCVSLPKLFYDKPGYTPLSFKLKDGSVIRYMQYIPPQAPKDKKLPLMVFLHGSGEAGHDTYSVLANGPWHYANTHPDFPFIVVAPQLDQDGEWSPEKLNEWLHDVEQSLPIIDRRHVYLTGLSRGGQGTWDFAMRYPHYFAAIAPVAAYSDVKEPCRLKGIPVWAFHGVNDSVVPFAQDQAVVDAAVACGIKVEFTVYPRSGHEIWGRTYDNPDLYTWMLRHKKPLIRMPVLFAPVMKDVPAPAKPVAAASSSESASQ